MNDPFDPFNALVAETPAEVLASGHEWVQKQFYEDDTMYTDYCLKFKDAAEADAVLFTEQTNVQDDIVEIVKTPKFAAVDVIGTIWKPTGNILKTKEGPVDEMAPLEGWHVNVRHTAEATELVAFQVFPQAPVRGWA